MLPVRREQLAKIKEKDSARTGSIEELVKSYLIHRGYLSTFDSLRRDQHEIRSGSSEAASSSSSVPQIVVENSEGMDVDEDESISSPPPNPLPPLPRSVWDATDAAARRVRIRKLISSGNLESALIHLEAHPHVKRSGVGFELKLAHLVGMILTSARKRKEASIGEGKGKEREGTLKRKAEEVEGEEGEDASSSATQRRRTGSASPSTSENVPSPAPSPKSKFLPSLPPPPSFPDIDILDRIISYGRQLRFTLEDPATAPPVPSSSSIPMPSSSSSSSSWTRSQTLFGYCLGLLAFEDPFAEGVELGEGGEKALGLWTGRRELSERIEEALLREYHSSVFTPSASVEAAREGRDGRPLASFRFADLFLLPPVFRRYPLSSSTVSKGETTQSELETVVRHTIATHTEMGRRGKGVASFVDVRERILF